LHCIPTRRSSDLARHLENLYGAEFAVDINKVGETQNIELFLDVANERFLPEQLGMTEAALAFLGEVLLDPAMENGAFRREYVTQEAEALRRRIESLINNKPQYALNRLREEMCRDEPFGLHKYGNVDELRQVTAEELFNHYHHVLATSPVDVFVVGPVEPDRVTEWVKERLPLPRGLVETPPAVAGPDPPARSERTVFEEQPVQQGVLALGYRTGTRYPDGDYAALLMYNGLLGGFPHSKLFVNVRKRPASPISRHRSWRPARACSGSWPASPSRNTSRRWPSSGSRWRPWPTAALPTRSWKTPAKA